MCGVPINDLQAEDRTPDKPKKDENYPVFGFQSCPFLNTKSTKYTKGKI
jgi:hypothetical protein